MKKSSSSPSSSNSNSSFVSTSSYLSASSISKNSTQSNERYLILPPTTSSARPLIHNQFNKSNASFVLPSLSSLQQPKNLCLSQKNETTFITIESAPPNPNITITNDPPIPTSEPSPSHSNFMPTKPTPENSCTLTSESQIKNKKNHRRASVPAFLHLPILPPSDTSHPTFQFSNGIRRHSIGLPTPRTAFPPIPALSPFGNPAASSPPSDGLPIQREGCQKKRRHVYSPRVSLCRKIWVLFAKCITFYALPPLLRLCGLKNKDVQLAWREKMALCSLFLLIMATLGLLTFEMNALLCPYNNTSMNANHLAPGYLVLNGNAFQMEGYSHTFHPHGSLSFSSLTSADRTFMEKDVSFFFQQPYSNLPSCRTVFGENYLKSKEYLFPCTFIQPNEKANQTSSLPEIHPYPNEFCHPLFASNVSMTPLVDTLLSQFRKQNAIKTVYFTWDTIAVTHFFVYNGRVIDFKRLSLLNKPVSFTMLIPGHDLETLFQTYRGKDATYFLNSQPQLRALGDCLSAVASVGSVDVYSAGCMVANLIIYVSLMAILALVLIRFLMALIYKWFLAGRLGKSMSPEEKKNYVMKHQSPEVYTNTVNHRRSSAFSFVSKESLVPSRHTTSFHAAGRSMGVSPNGNGMMYHTAAHRMSAGAILTQFYPSSQPATATPPPLSMPNTSTMLYTAPTLFPTVSPAPGNPMYDAGCRLPCDPLQGPVEPMYVIMLVTCYSEGEQGLRTTLNSLAQTDFLDSHKLILVIADGLVTGAGNTYSTPDLVLQMMERDPVFPESVAAVSYVAVAEGPGQHNMAQVHAGYYVYDQHRVPMICIVKCGTPEEQTSVKPGNRGKRDSQLILMSFLQKIMFDERMSAMDFDLFQKIVRVAKVSPEVYELILMVDADTKVHHEALDRMVGCFAKDSNIMGLCGETRIQNKYSSWVTSIQVFEYYISHHLAKSFESVFGGVTCLPGCFSAFRIKAPKTQHHWVPLLANPEIIEGYSENVVDTLHKKNLFLLGEDRYLTTLMLKTFPQRKMIFLPQAMCFTMVPDTFRVLLSQRRRWINSTIHNLMELVLIRDLCGIFCISMQFVICMELIGTIVLPAAMSFTLYLILISFFMAHVPVLPLAMLALILGLPGVLIVLTSGRLSLILWMMIYLASLPLWNLVLPLYAFWHFDDFSWGATRPTSRGEDMHALSTTTSHAEQGRKAVRSASNVVMKRYHEWGVLQHQQRRVSIPYVHPVKQLSHHGVSDQSIEGAH